MEFWKMNGTGNDFLIFNNMDGSLRENNWSAIGKVLCERHLSIGADGLMVVEPADSHADCKMLFFNSDGTVGEMCGNGARCICRYCFENGIAGEEQMIETTAGTVYGRRIDKRIYEVKLNNPTKVELDKTALIDGNEYHYSYVELGNPGVPHVVIPMERLREQRESQLIRIGRDLRFYKDFPKGSNVNFYELIGDDLIYERTYERGVEGFTYACGTGTASVVTVLYLKGKVSGNNTKVLMEGGELAINILSEKKCIKQLLLTGSTNIVAKGQVCDENFLP